MNEKLKATIVQRLEEMSDEAGRQLLDYVEFIESKYNRSTRDRTTFEKLADNVEGTLRGSRLGEATLKGTGDLIEAAGSVVRGVAAAGKAVLDGLQHGAGETSSGGEQATSSPEPGSTEPAGHDESASTAGSEEAGEAGDTAEPVGQDAGAVEPPSESPADEEGERQESA